MSLTVDKLLEYWRGGAGINAAQISALAQVQGMANMQTATRRANAQADCHFTGRYDPPEQCDDVQGIYFNPLIIGDKAIDQLASDDDPPTPPSPRQPPTRPIPTGWLALALAILLGAGALAWAIYNRPPSPSPSPPELRLRFLQEPP